MASEPDNTCQLYLITPPVLEPDSFAEILAKALDAGETACVQLRLKDVDDDTVRRAAERLAPVAQSRDVAFVMNDRPDLAVETGCDGVHIGQEDVSYEEARRRVGQDRIVGVTCHNSRHLAIVAAERGADYVAFGAFFPTTTKDPKTAADIDVLAWWAAMMEIPCVAIGGITPRNCGPLITAGADFLAVTGSVWNHPDGPETAIREFAAALG